MKSKDRERLFQALDRFKIELPSWGFADTGTRFGKFHQPAAASTIEDKLHDAGLVNQLTGACPSVAVHVLWDFDDPSDPASAKTTRKLAKQHGIKLGCINPNVFQDQVYKLGSFCSPDISARHAALQHSYDSIALGKAAGSRSIAMWLADGTNYPGQDNIRRRFNELKKALRKMHGRIERDWKGAKLLVEYKPFEPAFYHTDIPDWGASLLLCQHAGPKAKVLVDTGHHLPGCNIEQIVALLLNEGRLGGFHFNDRKYADDDLTLGSIDPYAVFRIFNEIAQYEFDKAKAPGSTPIDYMIDQSHNLKPKLEAMVQTVCEAQKLFAKAYLVDRKALAVAQAKGDITGAEVLIKTAFDTDVTPVLQAWRRSHDLPADPLQQLRRSGVVAKLGREREKARAERGETRSGSYA
ncbi:MAG: TIM barrel protein [Planctomycetota bacterium]